MGCNCGRGAAVTAPDQIFVVTLPNGSTKEVRGESAAKAEVILAGGGTYVAK